MNLFFKNFYRKIQGNTEFILLERLCDSKTVIFFSKWLNYHIKKRYVKLVASTFFYESIRNIYLVKLSEFKYVWHKNEKI